MSPLAMGLSAWAACAAGYGAFLGITGQHEEWSFRSNLVGCAVAPAILIGVVAIWVSEKVRP